jgi:hypothetical protein
MAKEVEKLRVYRLAVPWLLLILAYGWIERNVQPIITQQGSLAQMDDSWVGMIANQNAPNMINTIFFVLGLILLVIQIKLTRRKKQL